MTVNVTNGRIYVSTGSGTQHSKISSLDIVALAPQITSFSPNNGDIGRTVTLNGVQFTGATEVRLNGQLVSFRVASDTQITLTVPTNATTGLITVLTPGGTASTATEFKVLPRIGSFTPTGNVGGNMVITGANFLSATSVKINGLAASFTVNSATQITATVPHNATTGRISVTTSVGTVTSTINFVVAPRITSFTPTSGIVGHSVTLSGANFRGATEVRFHGVLARFVVVSSTQIVAFVPAGITRGPLTVTTPAGTATSANDFLAV